MAYPTASPTLASQSPERRWTEMQRAPSCLQAGSCVGDNRDGCSGAADHVGRLQEATGRCDGGIPENQQQQTETIRIQNDPNSPNSRNSLSFKVLSNLINLNILGFLVNDLGTYFFLHST